MIFSGFFFSEVRQIAYEIDTVRIELLADRIAKLRELGGRLFILGVGGSAANASHAVNDFRRLCGIEAYCPTDNISELTACTNDNGWVWVFKAWLETSKLNRNDALLILSVGGGDLGRDISGNIVHAINLAKAIGAKVFGIVGKSDGYTAQHGDLVILVPEVNPSRITPHSEAFQMVILHCLVSNPILQRKPTKW